MLHGEKLNAWTHLAGAVLAVLGTLVLLVRAGISGDVWKIIGVAVYGSALVTMYTVSTLYHSAQGATKALWQRLDHLSIYLLIAASYTPFCLVTLHGSTGWTLLAVVWGLALFGCIQEVRHLPGARILSMVIYLGMGWAALAALIPLRQGLGSDGFAWVAGGGIVYTLGIVFYAIDTRLRHGHGIWHLFVVGGSAAHYVAILCYVL